MTEVFIEQPLALPGSAKYGCHSSHNIVKGRLFNGILCMSDFHYALGNILGILSDNLDKCISISL